MREDEIAAWVSDACTFATATDLDSPKLHAWRTLATNHLSRWHRAAWSALAGDDKAKFGKIIGDAKASIAGALVDATSVFRDCARQEESFTRKF